MIRRVLFPFTRSILFTIIAFVFLLGSGPLAAQSTSEPLMERYQKARENLSRGNLREAQETLESLLENDPSPEFERRIHYLLGVVLTNARRQPVRALKSFNRVYSDTPHDNLTDDALYFSSEILHEELDQSSMAKQYLATIRDHFSGEDYYNDALELLDKIDKDTDGVDGYSPGNIPPPRVKLNFREAKLRDFINTYARLSGKNLLLDSQVSGTITLIGNQGIPVQELFKAFNQVLNNHGYTVVKNGSIYEVQQIQQALQSGIGSEMDKSGLRSEFFNLKGLPWNEIISALDTFLPQSKNLVRLRKMDRVLITSSPDKLDQVRRVIRTFRTMDGLDDETILMPYTPRHASPSEVSDKLGRLLPNYIREENFSILTDNNAGRILLLLPSSKKKRIHKLLETIDRDVNEGVADRLRMEVFRLQHADVSTVKQKLTELLQVTPGNFATENVKIVADNRQKALIVSSTSQMALKIISRTIDELDQKSETMPDNIRVFRLEHADEQELSETLKEIKNLLPGDYPGGEVKFIPHQRRRAVIVAAESSKVFTIVEDVINQIDKADVQQPMQHHVYDVKNSEAGPLAEKLSSLFEAREGSDGTRQLRVTADEQSNNLVLSASPQQWRTVRRMLNQLDQPKKQILVDVYIAEASRDFTEELGVEWNADGSIADRNLEAGPNFGFENALDNDNLFGLNAGLFDPTSDGSLTAMVHALDQEENFNLMSSSHLVANENEEATLSVGQIVPLKTKEQQSSENLDVSSSEFEFEDVGIELTLTPTLGGDSTVTLDMEQQIEEVIEPSDEGLPTRQTRDIQTIVAVPDAETLVLGGIIENQQNNTYQSVPYLDAIPGLRWLFRNEVEATQQRHLLVFLQPRIIGNTEDVREESFDLNEKREERTSLEERMDRLQQDLEKSLSGSP